MRQLLGYYDSITSPGNRHTTKAPISHSDSDGSYILSDSNTDCDNYETEIDMRLYGNTTIDKVQQYNHIKMVATSYDINKAAFTPIRMEKLKLSKKVLLHWNTNGYYRSKVIHTSYMKI